MWIYMAQIVTLNLWWPELWGSGLEPDVFPSSSVSGTDTETVNPLSWRAAWVSLWALQPDSASFSTDPAEFSNLAYHIFLRLLEVHFLHIFQSGVLMAHSSSHCKGKLPFFFFFLFLCRKKTKASCLQMYFLLRSPNDTTGDLFNLL